MTKRHMTDVDQERVVAIVDSWDEPKITWAKVQDRIEDRLGVRWTYPTLNARPAIVEHYEQAKLRIKCGPAKPKKVDDAEVEGLKQVIKDKDMKIESLKRILAEYDERFVRYTYNAHTLANLTPEVLNTPLPDLGRAED